MVTIDQGIHTLYGGTKLGLLIMKQVADDCLLSETQIASGLTEIQRRYAQGDKTTRAASYPIQAYTAYWKKFGGHYPVLAQLESILSGKKTLPKESGLRQAMFLTELESMLLTAGHDVSKVQLPLRLQVTHGSETYVSLSGREVTTAKDDMMICDGAGILSSMMRGPDAQSRMTATTDQVLFTMYAPPGIRTDTVEDALLRLQERIAQANPHAQTVSLQVFA